jgi:dihydrofolate reductase
MEINIIVAHDKNLLIGNSLGKTWQEQIPWHLPGDLKHFKKTTNNSPIIMGRKTFDSIGRILPGRLNIIVSRKPNYIVENALVFNSLERAFDCLKKQNHEKCFVIGGAEIYKQSLEKADKLFVTEVLDIYTGDTYFPQYLSKFRVLSQSEIFTENDIKFKFVELIRIT